MDYEFTVLWTSARGSRIEMERVLAPDADEAVLRAAQLHPDAAIEYGAADVIVFNGMHFNQLDEDATAEPGAGR